MYRGKMMGKNLKFARCICHGHSQSNCAIAAELRPPATRAREKLEAVDQIEFQMNYDLDPIELEDDDFYEDPDCLIDIDLVEALEKDPTLNVDEWFKKTKSLLGLYGNAS